MVSIQSQSALIASVITLSLTVRLLIQARKPWRFYAFAAVTGLLTAWNLCQFMADVTGWDGWGRLGTMAALFLPLSALTFFQLFLGDSTPARAEAGAKGERPTPSRVWGESDRAWQVMGVVALALVPFVVGLWDRRWVQITVFSYIFSSLYFGMVPIWQRLRDTTGPVERARLKYLLGGGLLSITFVLMDFVPRLEVWWAALANAPVLGNVIVVIFAYFLSEMLIQARLMGLSELFGKLAVLVPLALVLAVVYVLFSLLNDTPSRWFIFNTTIVMAFVVAILYEPMKALVEERIGRMIFRERYEFADQLDALRRAIANVVELDELAGLIMHHLEASRRVTQAALYLLEDDALGFRLMGSLGAMPARLDALADRVFIDTLKARRVLWAPELRDELEELRATDDDQAHVDALEHTLEVLERLKASACMSILSDGRIVGVLTVNDDRFREPYTPDEIRALTQIASQAAISVENSQAVSALREKDRLAAVGEMAAGLAHEIRNPLGAIKGAVQVLSLYMPEGGFSNPDDDDDDDDDDEPPEAFLDIIVEETNRLNKVVSQFLDYARPYRGDPAPCDVNTLVERTMPLFRDRASDWGVALVCVLADGLPEAHADAEQMKQVLLNLAINAIQACGTPPDTDAAGFQPAVSAHRDEDDSDAASEDSAPTLEITTSLTRRVQAGGGRFMAQDMLEIAVTDNGRGIPEAEQARIFIPFFTTKQKGTGLGLAISQRIVENLGGRIELSSSPEEGTTFRILLPLWDASIRSLSDL